MTAAQRSAISVGVRTTLIGAALIALASLTKDFVIFRPEFEAHINGVEQKMDAMLTLQCRQSPDDTICRSYR